MDEERLGQRKTEDYKVYWKVIWGLSKINVI